MVDEQGAQDSGNQSQKQQDAQQEEVVEQESLTDEAPEAGSEVEEALDIDQLKEQLEALEILAEQRKDAVLRAEAESQNVRRRAERDVENAHKFALEKMTTELLPVVDSLERALEAASDDAQAAMKEGVELTLGMFLKALEKFQIKPIDPVGEPFDPQLHQAMSMVEDDKVEPNSVVMVVQKGYALHGRLVRPAMVMVAKASAEASPKIDEQA